MSTTSDVSAARSTRSCRSLCLVVLGVGNDGGLGVLAFVVVGRLVRYLCVCGVRDRLVCFVSFVD